MTKKITKALALTVCAVLLVCGSVLGTMAYLTSTATVQNTFTVGNVSITLDELKTDVYGVATSGEQRVQKNAYKLVPGHTYAKDTTVHIAAGSEACYLFVKFDGILANAVTTLTFAESGIWNELAVSGSAVVYYTTVSATTNAQDIQVLTSFTIDQTATNTSLSGFATSDNQTVDIVAYAVQKAGFVSINDAWAAASAAASAQ